MKFIGIIVLTALAAFSQAALIDNFTAGGYNSGFIDTGSVENWANASGTPGGIRYTNVEVESNTSGGAARLQVVTGFGTFAVSSESGVDAKSSLIYGLATSSNAIGSNPLNLNLSSAPLIKIDFASNDLPLNLKVTLWTNNGASSFVRTQTVAGNNVTGTVQTVDFTADAASLGDVDAMRFDFDAADSGDYSITSINAVPEPTTLCGLGAAALAFARRRKQSK